MYFQLWLLCNVTFLSILAQSWSNVIFSILTCELNYIPRISSLCSQEKNLWDIKQMFPYFMCTLCICICEIPQLWILIHNVTSFYCILIFVDTHYSLIKMNWICIISIYSTHWNLHLAELFCSLSGWYISDIKCIARYQFYISMSSIDLW